MVCIKWLNMSSSFLKALEKSSLIRSKFWGPFRPRAFNRHKSKPQQTFQPVRRVKTGTERGENSPSSNREGRDQRGGNGPWEAGWVTGIGRTRDCTIQVCLCFDCGLLCCICSLIRWEQLHCDWEPAAWGIMRGSISAHRASKGNSADPLWWKIILMIGRLFCVPVLVKTLSSLHSLPLSPCSLLEKDSHLGSSVLDYLVLMCSDSMRWCRLNTFRLRTQSAKGAFSMLCGTVLKYLDDFFFWCIYFNVRIWCGMKFVLIHLNCYYFIQPTTNKKKAKHANTTNVEISDLARLWDSNAAPPHLPGSHTGCRQS